MPFFKQEILIVRPPESTPMKSKLGKFSQIAHLYHHLRQILKIPWTKFDREARSSFLEMLIPKIAVFGQLLQRLVTAIEAFCRHAAVNLWKFFGLAGSSSSHVTASMLICHKMRRTRSDRRLKRAGAYWRLRTGPP